jgi:hypothetical protein
MTSRERFHDEALSCMGELPAGHNGQNRRTLGHSSSARLLNVPWWGEFM